MKKNVLRIAAVVVSLVIVIVAARSIHAGVIARSKQNICNNFVVIGSTMGQPGAPEGGHVLLMDTCSGETWDYSAKALAGAAAPRYVSTIRDVGDMAQIDPRYKTQ